jgi:hypothetical protein
MKSYPACVWQPIFGMAGVLLMRESRTQNAQENPEGLTLAA